jgi:hypothetical protein
VVKIHERKQDDKDKLSFNGMASFYGNIIKKFKEKRDEHLANKQQNQEPID